MYFFYLRITHGDNCKLSTCYSHRILLTGFQLELHNCRAQFHGIFLCKYGINLGNLCFLSLIHMSTCHYPPEMQVGWQVCLTCGKLWIQIHTKLYIYLKHHKFFCMWFHFVTWLCGSSVWTLQTARLCYKVRSLGMLAYNKKFSKSKMYHNYLKGIKKTKTVAGFKWGGM